MWGHASERPAFEPVFLQRAWYIDWAYDRFIARPSTEVAIETSSVVEAKGIDGAVNGFAWLVTIDRLATCAKFRPVTSATTRSGWPAGLVLVLAYVLTRAS